MEKRKLARHDNLRIIRDVKNRYKQIKIPQLIVGESIVQIIEKTGGQSVKFDKDSKLKEFFDLVEDLTDLNYNSPPLNEQILRTALNITNDNDDRNMDYCDAIITSFALTSDCSCHLLTKDKEVIYSDLVYEIIKDQKKKNIHIGIIDFSHFK